MSLKDFITGLPHRHWKDSVHSIREWTTEKTLANEFSKKTVYDSEWDTLVILDACRVDLLCEVVSEYEWLPDKTNIENSAIHSVAGSSKEWMERTFGKTDSSVLKETAYITGNPFSEEALNSESLGLLDEVWRYRWDTDVGTIRPEPLIERAIQVSRTDNYDRVIVHLMQPHAPFINNPSIHSGYNPQRWGATKEPDIWNRIRREEVGRQTVWKAYRENLQIALNSVQDLMNNIDGKMVISADHGNALGDHGIWGHPDIPVDSIRRVPWVSVDAENIEGRNVDLDPESDQQDVSIEDRLSALGYK
jgi:hypothetical protein